MHDLCLHNRWPLAHIKLLFANFQKFQYVSKTVERQTLDTGVIQFTMSFAFISKWGSSHTDCSPEMAFVHIGQEDVMT